MIAAGIVIFNPDINRIIENIKSIINQVDLLILYLNSEFNNEIICDIDKEIVYLGNGKNVGLAKALNCIMEEAYNRHLEWVITLDQDSVCPNNIISEYKKYMFDDVALISPIVVDKRRIQIQIPIKNDFQYLNRCITSAALTNVSIWNNVGRFDEVLFIDLIDNDFSKRVILSGYKIIRVNTIQIDQEYGEIIPKKQWKINFYMKLSKIFKGRNAKNRILKLTYKKKVSPLRVYYTNRNIEYLNRKYINYGGIGYDCYSAKNKFQFNIFFNLASIIRGKNKIKIFKAIRKGKKDGKALNVVPFGKDEIND